MQRFNCASEITPHAQRRIWTFYWEAFWAARRNASFAELTKEYQLQGNIVLPGFNNGNIQPFPLPYVHLKRLLSNWFCLEIFYVRAIVLLLARWKRVCGDTHRRFEDVSGNSATV